MKFVFFGYDFSLNVAQRLINDGHELLGVFTFPCDGIFNHNTQLLSMAKDQSVLTSLEPVTSTDIETFIDEGATLFVCCGYPFKIPPINTQKAYGINIHPSLLPKARGLMPTPHIMMNERDAAGFTIHKISEVFDAGDILFQYPIALKPNDSVDDYSAAIAAQTPAQLSKIVKNLEDYWAKATPQDSLHATRAPVPDDAMRMLNWHDPLEVIMRTARAFGTFGSLGRVNGKLYAVYECSSSMQIHGFTPGTLIYADAHSLSVAVCDGVFTFTRFDAL